jgi:DNA repair protein RadC
MTTHSPTTPSLFDQPGADACSEPHSARFVPVFSVRLVRERAISAEGYATPADAARLFSRYLDGCDREHFAIAMLTAQNTLIGIHTAHVGALTACIVSPRDVFKVALLANAASVIVAHNHPSGSLEPSSADVHLSRLLRDAGKMMDLPVLDSLVIGFDGAYTSLAERGLLA